MRVSWKQVVFVLLVGAVIVLWWFELQSQRLVLGVVPVDGQRAVALGLGRAGYAAIGVERGGGRAWTTALPQIRAWAPSSGASATGATFTIRALEDGGTVQTIGFDLDTGTELWRGGDSGLTDVRAMIPAYITNLADSTTVYEFHANVPHTVFALDRNTGSTRFRAELPEDVYDVAPPVRAWLREGWLIVDKPATLAFVDRANGAMQVEKARRWACVAPDAVLFEPESDSRLIHKALPSLAETDLGALEGSLVGLCGVRDGVTLVAVDDEHRTDVLLVDRQLERAGTIDLGPWSLMSEAGKDSRASYPDAVPFSGNLTRFVPMQAIDWALDRKEAPAEPGLIVVDTDQRAIAWEARHSELASFQLVSHDGRHYLVRQNAVAVIDGATGELGAAVEIAEAAEIRPYHFAGGRLWVTTERAVVALDGATLEVSGGWGTVTTADIRAPIAAMLGRD